MKLLNCSKFKRQIGDEGKVEDSSNRRVTMREWTSEILSISY